VRWKNIAGWGDVDASPPAGHPVPTLLPVIKMTMTSNNLMPNQIDCPVWAKGGKELWIDVFVKHNNAFGSGRARAQLIDPDYALSNGSSLLVNTQAANDDTNWQLIQLRYTPAYDKPLVLRITATNSTSYLHFNYRVRTGVAINPGLAGGLR
jgi:hypothetical protein